MANFKSNTANLSPSRIKKQVAPNYVIASTLLVGAMVYTSTPPNKVIDYQLSEVVGKGYFAFVMPAMGTSEKQSIKHLDNERKTEEEAAAMLEFQNALNKLKLSEKIVSIAGVILGIFLLVFTLLLGASILQGLGMSLMGFILPVYVILNRRERRL
ncbi:hypothetical protein HB999_06130 [Listeria booriae]|uniref:Uncharacterized protein n=1 Tax=Listeria booriae TaxID=1552123 RepID=A0A7X1C0Z5_9LIST|nr:hypothetical protein [Listeria booriae]MBC1317738.1 hypothetical protein [Listeria booriae]MBC1358278.1 hypothetical protein [Listeria booriae]MBC6163038.1 hypothetical protein [Listeria booriae]